MNAAQLRALQAPLKTSYREDPSHARLTLKASGRLGGDTVTCRLETPHGVIVAGLHPATGGDGKDACSGDMLLEALVACAGGTLKAVPTAVHLPPPGGPVRPE